MDTPLANPDADATDVAARRDAAVAWLMSRINYERVAVLPYNERTLKLDRMRQLLTRLGSPDKALRIVHVAGTKGKGSTAAMIAAVLTASGRRTGVYSSPHLERIEERWAVDGLPCTADDLIGLVDRMKPIVAAMDAEADPSHGDAAGPPTFFDITTAMALVHFADRQCDAVVLEVGLGGRLDSTNVCLPVVSVITSISFDHTKQLGPTLGAIAGEKAGIVKPGVPVVSGVRQDEPRRVIARIARERGCRLLEPPADKAAGYAIGLAGEHQAENAAVAIAVVEELRDQGWAISTDACRDGLAAARLAARVERFAGEPEVVIDTAHNDASAKALADAVGEIRVAGTRTLVLAVSRDKDLAAIVSALAPRFDRVIATRFIDNPRAVEPNELAEAVRDTAVGDAPVAPSVAVADSPADAWRTALEQTPGDGLIVIAGSFFIAAELRPLVATRAAEQASH